MEKERTRGRKREKVVGRGGEKVEERQQDGDSVAERGSERERERAVLWGKISPI